MVTPPTILLQSSGSSFCVTKPMELVTIPQALCIEFIATGTLIWFCCAIWDPRNAKNQDSVALRFALAIAGIVSASVRFILYRFIVFFPHITYLLTFIDIISIFKGQFHWRKYVSFRRYQIYFKILKNQKRKKNQSHNILLSIGFNPARSTGPALWTGDYELLWVNIYF